MKEDSRFVTDILASIYTVIKEYGLEYNKENAKRVANALAEISAQICVLVDANLDEFHKTADECYSEMKGTYTSQYIQKFLDKKNPSYADELKTKIENLPQESQDYVQMSEDMFVSIYDKCMEVMREKNVLVKDMPIMIGCLGSAAAYFSELYGVKRNFLTQTIEKYYAALEKYDALAEKSEESSSSDEDVKSNVINFPTKKNPYNLN